MKKRYLLTTGLLSLSLLYGCSGISQEDYDAVNAQLESVKKELTTAQENANSIQAELDQALSDKESVEASLNNVQSDYDAYKESMSEYEGLAAAEAEARQIEAESIAESEAAAKAAAEEAERAAKEAEEKAGYETGITYDQLARTPDDYEGKLVKFSGKVVQVIEGDTEIQIRMAVNSNYDTILFCGYSPDIVPSRVLEDDIITIYGSSIGLLSYESTMGGNITIPAVWVDKIDQ